MTRLRPLACLIALIALCATTPAYAQLGSVPYTFAPGGTISSASFNQMFSAIYANALNRTGGTMTGTLNTLTVLPTSDNTVDLGSSSFSYRNGYFDGAVAVGSITTSGGGLSISGKITATLTTAQFRAAYDGSNHLELSVASTGASTFTATGSGAVVIFNTGIRERSRTVAMGEWATQAYAAGDFTASSSTWGVDSGDVTLNRYMLVGKTLTWQFTLVSTDIGGTPAHLRIALPTGVTASANTAYGACGRAVDAGGSATPFVATWLIDGAAYLKLFRADGGTWNTTSGDDMAIACTVVLETT